MDTKRTMLGMLVALTALAVVIIVLLVTPDAEAQYTSGPEGKNGWSRNDEYKAIFRVLADKENNVYCYSYGTYGQAQFSCVAVPVERPCEGGS